VTDSVIASVAAGDSPCALCYNPLNNKVYCANRGSNNVTVIDCVTDSVIAAVATGSSPSALCYNSQNNKVYCANQNSNSVTVIDCAADSAIATLATGDYPSALCYNPQNDKVYCGNCGHTVTAIDGLSDNVITTYTVGYFPWHLCYGSQFNKVYCASTGGVTVIDGGSNFGYMQIDFGDGYEPGPLLSDLTQGRVYAADNKASRIWVVRDTVPSGVATPSDKTRTTRMATIVRGVLFLPAAKGDGRMATGVLVDALGRKVLGLKRGANDVHALAPGVYFVRGPKTEDGRPAAAVRKVVVTR